MSTVIRSEPHNYTTQTQAIGECGARTGVVVPEVGAGAQVAAAAVHVQAVGVQRGGVPVPRRARARRAHLLPRLALWNGQQTY